MIVVRVGRGDAGSCRHGCTEDRRGVVAPVAIGDGADTERAREARSSSCAGELPHGGGVRTRRCAVAIIMVIIVFGSGSGRCAQVRCSARTACGSIARSGLAISRSCERGRRATVDWRATGRTCRVSRSRSAQRAGRHDRHERRAWWRRAVQARRHRCPARCRGARRHGHHHRHKREHAWSRCWPMQRSAAGKASRSEPRSNTLLRGERPSKVRSTETDAMPKPWRGCSRLRARGAGAKRSGDGRGS